MCLMVSGGRRGYSKTKHGDIMQGIAREQRWPLRQQTTSVNSLVLYTPYLPWPLNDTSDRRGSGRRRRPIETFN